MLWLPILASGGPIPAPPYIAGATAFLLAWPVRSLLGKWASGKGWWLTLPAAIAVFVGLKMFFEDKPIPEVAPVIVNAYAGFWLGSYFWFFSDQNGDLEESD